MQAGSGLWHLWQMRGGGRGKGELTAEGEADGKNLGEGEARGGARAAEGSVEVKEGSDA